MLIIPLYYLLLRLENGFRCLVYGATLSFFIALGYCIYEVAIQGQAEFEGIYSRLYTGPIILLYATLTLGYLFTYAGEGGWRVWLLILAVAMAAGYSINATHARVAYIGVLVLALLFAGLYAKQWWKWVVMILIITVTLGISLFSPDIKNRMQSAYNEFEGYIAISKTSEQRVSAPLSSSVGTRMEMWRIAPLMLRDHTRIGVGNGNYNKAMKTYYLLIGLVVFKNHMHALKRKYND